MALAGVELKESDFIRTKADELAKANGCYWDERAAVRVEEFFFKFLRHSKGEWQGKPFSLLDWQRNDLICPLFGWKRANGTRRFRKTYIQIAKKNGKSAIASAVGLYMLAGDQEAGAEIYSAASDKDQAGIVHREAINMVDASEQLQAALKVNRSTFNISYPKNKSFYRALSGEAESKEGLNAHCVICDEVHVWKGRKTWDALRYAFRARRQGLLFVITTAGDDIQSVCYQEYTYAKSVLSGAIADERFFAYVAEADPKDDYREPAVWKKANPSFGITVKADDFAADVREAEKSPTSLSAFKRYSLNIWATATNPWLKMDYWRDCAREFTEADLYGRPCFAGLDLAKTQDMTALVLVFPEGPDCFKILPYFWLPELTVADTGKPEEYRVWARQGLLKTTPGNKCDYAFITKHIGQLSEKFRILDLAFDPYAAPETTNNLSEQFGINCIEFGQTIKNFAAPTSEFERIVIGGTMLHNSHPILDWQAGHVSVYSDCNNNKRPVKPAHGDNRKIDGIVAAIMGLGRAMLKENQPSVYESRGLVIL